MRTKSPNKIQDSLVGLYFVSFEFGDVDWRGRVVSRKNDRYCVALEPATMFVLTGISWPYAEGEYAKRKFVRVADTADWKFFRTAQDRDFWALEELSS